MWVRFPRWALQLRRFDAGHPLHARLAKSGRRAALRSPCPSGRPGSTPGAGTQRVVAQRPARLLWEQEIVGSSPTCPTTRSITMRGGLLAGQRGSDPRLRGFDPYPRSCRGVTPAAMPPWSNGEGSGLRSRRSRFDSWRGCCDCGVAGLHARLWLWRSSVRFRAVTPPVLLMLAERRPCKTVNAGSIPVTGPGPQRRTCHRPSEGPAWFDSRWGTIAGPGARPRRGWSAGTATPAFTRDLAGSIPVRAASSDAVHC